MCVFINQLVVDVCVWTRYPNWKHNRERTSNNRIHSIDEAIKIVCSTYMAHL